MKLLEMSCALSPVSLFPTANWRSFGARGPPDGGPPDGLMGRGIGCGCQSGAQIVANSDGLGFESNSRYGKDPSGSDGLQAAVSTAFWFPL